MQVFYLMYPRLFQRLEHSSMKGRLLTQNGHFLYDSGNSNGFCDNLEGRGGEGDGRRFGREGTWVYWWLILIDVWQKTTKFCKAHILKLKKINEREKKKRGQNLSCSNSFGAFYNVLFMPWCQHFHWVCLYSGNTEYAYIAIYELCKNLYFSDFFKNGEN